VVFAAGWGGSPSSPRDTAATISVCPHLENVPLYERQGFAVLGGFAPQATVWPGYGVLTLFSDKIISRMVAIRQPATEFIGSAIV
jgi:hypothetical protein